jgi:GGDEF domain-containing protein
LNNVDGLPAVVRKIADAVRRPVSFEGQEMRVSASVGFSLYPDDGQDPDQLIRSADMAMYAAKAAED